MADAYRNIKVTKASEYALQLAKKHNLRLTSAYRSPTHPLSIRNPKSDHIRGQAYDFAGTYANMNRFASELYRTGMYKQVIFNDRDYVRGYKVGGHMDHVHVAWQGQGYKDENRNGRIDLGEKGGIVETIQKLLDINIDGYYGPDTQKAIKDFQEKHGLEVDGVTGKNTWETLTKGGYSVFFS